MIGLLLLLQKQKNVTKVDIVAMAKEWGCKVVYLDELLAELKKLKPVPQNSKVKKIAKGERGGGRERVN